MKPIMIIGSGLAGYGLLRELHNRQCPVPRLLITADGGESYSKPMLSTALGQNRTPADLVMDAASAMAGELHADILTHTRVREIDSDGHRVILDSGEERSYDKLVLAVGSSPIRLPMTGDGAQEVLSINTLDDYIHFRQRLAHAKSVAIIGPGLIGSEFANDLLLSQRKVAIIGPDPWPISTLVPQAAGEAVARALAAQGATWHLGTFNGPIEKTASGYRTVLKNGETVAVDLVVSAVGIRPEIQLAQASGLKTNRGILTDKTLRTSHPDIFAVGDCAEVDGRNLPFVQPLMIGVRALAATLMGHPQEIHYPAMPVLIKTTLHPVVTLPPSSREGSWTFTGTAETGIEGRFFDPNGKLAGFVLTGDRTPEKATLMTALAS
ncbi:MAG: FAD-dependent oxidoreductase [Magnetococcales bacterium]|nr:FAD-dependent oxidoreductase [Magnetococcales bacterium]